MATKLRRGNLNPDADNGLTFSVNASGNIITVDDTNVDYSGYSATITNGKKVFILTDNNIDSGSITQNMVYKSSLDEVGSTAFKYSNYQDGWFTSNLIYVQGYSGAIPNSSNIYEGLIIFYTNGSDTTDDGFYVALQDGSGSTVQPSADSDGEYWKIAEYTDYISFIKLIDNRTSAGQSFLGEYGMQQDQVLTYLNKKLDEYSVEAARKFIEMPSYKPCDDASVTKFSVLDTLLFAAAKLFCQERISESQEVVQEALFFVSDPSRRGLCNC